MANTSPHPHVVVIGAGPAGLGVSIGLASKGIAVTVLEKERQLGSIRRGETIRADMHMEEILGPAFFERIALRRVNCRKYFSHSGNNSVERTIQNPNIIFSWPDLIREMSFTAESLGVTIEKGIEVTGFMEDSGSIRGAVSSASGKEREIPSDAVFSCGGFADPASRYTGQDRSTVDMAAKKRLVKGYTGQDYQLEYHFHLESQGMVIGAVFPRGGGEAELILLRTTAANRTPLSFEEFGRSHPGFARIMEATEVFYDLDTFIPMGGMLYPISPKPGLVMAGDALGQVQGRGGSGIKTSFLIGHAAGSAAADVLKSGGWTLENWRLYEKTMRKNSQVRSLMLHNLIYATLRAKIFGWIRSSEDMDRKWPLLKTALR